MKKLLIVAVVALLALALVACGGGDKPAATTAATTVGGTVETTPVVEDTTPTTPADTGVETTPVVGDTTPNTPADTGVETTPVVGDTTPNTPAESTGTTPDVDEPIDILYGALEDAAINATWQGLYAPALENHHADLEFHFALVTLWEECDSCIYEELVMTVEDEVEGTSIWVINEDYKWVVTINGEKIEIDRFSVYNNVTSGYIRLDLGEWTYEKYEKNENGKYVLDMRLDIIDAHTEEVAYYAYFTDPEWVPTYEFTPPQPIEMVVDPNRDSSHVAIEGATGLSGPTGYTNELYGNLFDGEVQSKLCTEGTEPIVWSYEEAVYVVSYSLVGANDDATYTDRVILGWKLYGSETGNDGTWNLIDEQSVEAAEEVLNYVERNFKLDTAAEYQYFKLEPVGATKYQMSGIILYTTETTAG